MAFPRINLTADQIRPKLALHYADRLDAGELQSLNQFFESPVGRRFVEVWGSDHGPALDAIRTATEQARAEVRRRFQNFADLDPSPGG